MNTTKVLGQWVKLEYGLQSRHSSILLFQPLIQSTDLCLHYRTFPALESIYKHSVLGFMLKYLGKRGTSNSQMLEKLYSLYNYAQICTFLNYINSKYIIHICRYFMIMVYIFFSEIHVCEHDMQKHRHTVGEKKMKRICFSSVIKSR